MRISITNKRMHMLFWISFLAPMVILTVKPCGYSFYMFYPATPDSTFDQFHLIIANILYVASFAIMVLSSFFFIGKVSSLRNCYYIIFPIICLITPLHQPIFLEGLDNLIGWQMYHSAKKNSLQGMIDDEVLDYLGKPSDTTQFKNCWQYKQIPIYFLGSSFQIFFHEGRVSYYEANDD